MEREEEKSPKNIMLAGGISYYDLSDLIIVEGTMNEFAYALAPFYYIKIIWKNSKKIKTLSLSKMELPAIQINLINSY